MYIDVAYLRKQCSGNRSSLESIWTCYRYDIWILKHRTACQILSLPPPSHLPFFKFRIAYRMIDVLKLVKKKKKLPSEIFYDIWRTSKAISLAISRRILFNSSSIQKFIISSWSHYHYRYFFCSCHYSFPTFYSVFRKKKKKAYSFDYPGTTVQKRKTNK